MDTVIFLVLLLAIVVIVMLLLVGMRRGGGQVAAGDEARVQQAFPFEGMIVGFEEIGEGRDGHGPFRALDFAFEIQPPGESPYQARTAWKVYRRSDAALQLGRTVPIKVDLDDPLVIYPDMPGVEYNWARIQAMQRR
jgi:hypothetical protein